jgi:drug/metabolite transporter (DMT)-like permease
MAAILALSAAVFWGVADFVAGIQARRVSVLLVVLISQFVGLMGLGLLVLARGVGPPPIDLAALGVATGVVGTVAISSLYWTLARGNMARVAPIFGTAAAIPVIVGLATGERPSRIQMIGIVCAIVGVTLVSVERAVEEHERQQGSGVMIVAVGTAICLGSAILGVKRVSEYDPYWAVFLLRITSVMLLVFAMTVVGRSPRGLSSPTVVSLACVGLLDVSANVFFSVATTRGLLSLVAVLSTVFPAVTVMLSLIILRERLDSLQALGVVTTLIGSALITAG